MCLDIRQRTILAELSNYLCYQKEYNGNLASIEARFFYTQNQEVNTK